MAEYYLKSQTYQKVLGDVAEWTERVEREKPVEEFRVAVKESKGKGARAKSIYSVSFIAQVWAIVVRQAQLTWGFRVSSICSVHDLTLIPN